MGDLNLERALDAATSAVARVAPHLAAGFGNTAHTNKSTNATDVVTLLDVRAEEMIVEALAAFDANIGFSGEELGVSGSRVTYWLIDPIDGTGHFIRGLPFCTTMLALIHDNQPVVAVINDFVRGRMYTATTSASATCNGRPLHVSTRALPDAYVTTEIGVTENRNAALMSRLTETVVPMQTINCGWDIAMILEGRLEGRLMKDPYGKDHDYAPGVLLVRAAGGVVENIGTRTCDFRNHDLLMTNVEVNRALTAGPDALFPVDKT